MADVFAAIAEPRRREIIGVLAGGEKSVGTIVADLSLAQPQVSKHLRVLSDAGLVTSRADGRRRLYRLEPARFRPLHEWLARMDRVERYLEELQRQGDTT